VRKSPARSHVTTRKKADKPAALLRITLLLAALRHQAWVALKTRPPRHELAAPTSLCEVALCCEQRAPLRLSCLILVAKRRGKGELRHRAECSGSHRTLASSFFSSAYYHISIVLLTELLYLGYKKLQPNIPLVRRRRLLFIRRCRR